jgi:carboxylate-amine ligase
VRWDWSQGKRSPPVDAEMLRLASWRASRLGIQDDLIHPEMSRPHRAEACVGALLHHIQPVPTETGNWTVEEETIRQIMADWTGAGDGTLALQRCLVWWSLCLLCDWEPSAEPNGRASSRRVSR